MYCILTNKIFIKIDDWMSKVDFDGDGSLSFEEFKFSFAGNLDIEL